MEREQNQNDLDNLHEQLPERKPPVAPSEPTNSPSCELSTVPPASEPITVAEIVESNRADPAIPARAVWPTPIDNHAATGGAVGSVALGVWSIIAAFITPWSMINAVLGSFLAIWGLQSPRTRTAITGLVICGIGGLLSVINLPLLLRSGGGPASPPPMIPNSALPPDTFDPDNPDM